MNAKSRRATPAGVLLFAFAFAVMADPVSSVAYAIEAALRALKGHLGLLVLTMALVLAIIFPKAEARWPPRERRLARGGRSSRLGP